MMRAGAGDQDAARCEKLQRAAINFLVATNSSFKTSARLGECGRVQNDGIDAALCGGVARQQVENVGLAELEVLNRVGGPVPLRDLEARFGTIHCFDGLALPRHVERKPAGGCKAIERAAMRVSRGR